MIAAKLNKAALNQIFRRMRWNSHAARPTNFTGLRLSVTISYSLFS